MDSDNHLHNQKNINNERIKNKKYGGFESPHYHLIEYCNNVINLNSIWIKPDTVVMINNIN